MNLPSSKMGALLGAITSIPVMALFYLGERLAKLPMVPFDLFDWQARVLPGGLVTAGIDAMTDIIIALNLGETSGTAKRLEQLMALALFLLIGAILGAVTAWIMRRSNAAGWQIGGLVGTGALVIVLVLELQLDRLDPPALALPWLTLIFAGWGSVLGAGLSATLEPEADSVDGPARRQFLTRVAVTSAAVAAGGWGLGRLLGEQAANSGAERPLTEALPTRSDIQATVTPSLRPTASAIQRDQLPPAPGTRLELTPNDEFYRIDINALPPVLEEASWELTVDGLFDSPRNLTLKDLMAFPVVKQAITLSCISNRIGGDLIGTSEWTGARLRDVLNDLGLRPEAKELYVEAADGFFESVDMNDLMDPRTLLVYGMNGETLPVDHGFPLRIYIPNRYGMKQPKWISRIEAIPEEGAGYWVVRGWSEEARPRIISVIDTVATDEPSAEGLIPIGGIAWAGDRGIQKVEIQFDGGEWVEVILRTPPLSPLTWVQWRYDWAAVPGRHTVRVRATDGTGALQIEKESGVRPDGATGYHSMDFRV